MVYTLSGIFRPLFPFESLVYYKHGKCYIGETLSVIKTRRKLQISYTRVYAYWNTLNTCASFPQPLFRVGPYIALEMETISSFYFVDCRLQIIRSHCLQLD